MHEFLFHAIKLSTTCYAKIADGNVSYRSPTSHSCPNEYSVYYSTPTWTLTHWGRGTHICVSKITIIGLDNGLSPGRRQAIIWTNAGIVLIGLLATIFSEILIGIETFSSKKMLLKMSSAKWRPFCLGLNVLAHCGPVMPYWWHRSGSTLARVMACCLMAPSHYLNQCWVIISEALWHSSAGNFTGNTQVIYPWNEFENYQFKITATPHRGQWVNSLWLSDTIWRHKSGSKLAQVMACCLMAPSHYLNQCWLIITKV